MCVRERERESALFSFSAVLYPRTADEVGLGGLLEGQDGRRLEAQVGLEVLGDLADQALEGQLADQEVGRLLVLADLAERDRSRAVPVGLLDTAWSGRFEREKKRGEKTRSEERTKKRRSSLPTLLWLFALANLSLGRLLARIPLKPRAVASRAPFSSLPRQTRALRLRLGARGENGPVARKAAAAQRGEGVERLRMNENHERKDAPVAGADLRAALVASCLRGALPPVDLRAVCLVRAIVSLVGGVLGWGEEGRWKG